MQENGTTLAEGFDKLNLLDVAELVPVKCEICDEIFAKVNLVELSLPFRGTMFHSKDPHHGFPDPFHPDASWEDMRCPYCRRRPFTSQDKIKLSNNTFLEVHDATEDHGHSPVGE